MAKTVAEYSKERYYSLKAQKKCVQCGQADDNTKAGRSHCKACAEKFSAYNKKLVAGRVAKGLCIRCGEKSGDYSYCKKCRQKRSVRYQKQKSGGQSNEC